MREDRRAPAFFPEPLLAAALVEHLSLPAMSAMAETGLPEPESGDVLRLVGDVKLNEEEAPTITIRHYFGIYADMTAGTDGQGNPIPLRIARLKLNPDGNFTFSNGAYEEIPTMDEYGLVKISIRFKDDVFKRLKREAEQEEAVPAPGRSRVPG